MTQLIAHRGLSKRFPENSHAAFSAAWKTNCDGIELDIQVSKDGQVLVIHDSETRRTAPQQANKIIAETTFAELKSHDIGAGECIPQLSEVIEKMPAGKIIQIEIKQHITDMDTVIHAFQQLRDDIAVQIISFVPEKLLMVREALPQLDCLLVMDKETPNLADPIAFATEHGLLGLDIDAKLLTAEYITRIHAAGLTVGTWTVDCPGTAKQLIDWKVNYIASNVADELLCLKH